MASSRRIEFTGTVYHVTSCSNVQAAIFGGDVDRNMILVGKRAGFTLDDFKACAQGASMKRGRAETIVAEVRAVVARWRDYADEARVNPAQRDKIQATLRVEAIR